MTDFPRTLPRDTAPRALQHRSAEQRKTNVRQASNRRQAERRDPQGKVYRQRTWISQPREIAAVTKARWLQRLECAAAGNELAAITSARRHRAATPRIVRTVPDKNTVAQGWQKPISEPRISSPVPTVLAAQSLRGYRALHSFGSPNRQRHPAKSKRLRINTTYAALQH